MTMEVSNSDDHGVFESVNPSAVQSSWEQQLKLQLMSLLGY